MKKSTLVLAACSLVAGVIMTSCTSSATKVDNAQDKVIQANKDLNKANQEYLEDITSYRLETEKRIEANDESITEFKAKIAHDKKAIKAENKKKLAELEQKNQEMKRKLNDYKAEGKEKWIQFKSEFNHDMDELGHAFKDLTVKNIK